MLNREIRNAALGMQLPWLDGLRGTGVNATSARSTRIARHRIAGRQVEGRDNFAKHNPTAHTFFANQLRVLADAAMAGALGMLALQNWRGVHAHSKTISGKSSA